MKNWYSSGIWSNGMIRENKTGEIRVSVPSCQYQYKPQWWWMMMMMNDGFISKSLLEAIFIPLLYSLPLPEWLLYLISLPRHPHSRHGLLCFPCSSLPPTKRLEEPKWMTMPCHAMPNDMPNDMTPCRCRDISCLFFSSSSFSWPCLVLGDLESGSGWLQYMVCCHDHANTNAQEV